MYNIIIWALVAIALFIIYVSSIDIMENEQICISDVCISDINAVTSQCTENTCLFNLEGSKVITVLDHAYSWTVGGNCIMVEKTSSGNNQCINSFYFEKSKWDKKDYIIQEKHVTVFSKR